MFFNRKTLGLEIYNNGIAFVLAGVKRSFPYVERYAVARFPGDIVRASMKEANIIEPDVLRAAISDCYAKLSTKIKRVALSIPDAAGRVMLVNMEMPVKDKQEGLDHVRWKLKKNFPLDINDLHLDYQVIRHDGAGSALVLVSLVSRGVVREYEDMLLELELEPSFVDFASFNLYRVFSSRLDMQEHSLYISLSRGSLSVFIFQDGSLEFYRNKFLGYNEVDPARLFREISSSLLVYSDMKGGLKPRNVFCYVSGESGEMLRSLLVEAIGIEPVFMDTVAIASGAKQQMDRETIPDILTALGAASRSLS